MVLVENTPSFARAWQAHPDLRRSLAYAGAIALNFALLLLVSLPMPAGKTVVLARPPEVVTQVVPVEKEKQPPPKPPVVPVTVREIPHPQIPVTHTRAPTPPVDVAVLPDTHRRKRLLVADMDSTIIGQECIDELADLVGLRTHVGAITERAMRGEIAFEPALRERVALLIGRQMVIHRQDNPSGA